MTNEISASAQSFARTRNIQSANHARLVCAEHRKELASYIRLQRKSSSFSAYEDQIDDVRRFISWADELASKLPEKS